MGEGKIELTLGALSFSGEGEQEWLAQQFDKILESAVDLAKIGPVAIPVVEESSGPPKLDTDNGMPPESLASYIKSRGGASNQVVRFLATAYWLCMKGDTNLTTASVSKALKDYQQTRLSNPADCLNKNVSKGFCEKQGNEFFITPEGLQALGAQP